MTRFVYRQAEIAEPVVFDVDIGPERMKIIHNLPHIFVDVVSLGSEGEHVQPTSGTYTVTYKDSREGAFKPVDDNGILLAKNTAGSLMPDGVQRGASFVGNPLVLKITPDAVDVATSYRVTVKQNLS